MSTGDVADLPCRAPAAPRSGDGARPHADREGAGRARDAATPVDDRERDPQRRPLDRRDAVGRRSPSATAMPACREDTIQVKLDGHRRARASAPGSRAASRSISTGEGQRLCRQGPVGRQAHRQARRAMPASCRKSRSSSATPCSTARSPASAISAASPASASRCAIPARSRWSRAPAIMAANT